MAQVQYIQIFIYVCLCYGFKYIYNYIILTMPFKNKLTYLNSNSVQSNSSFIPVQPVHPNIPHANPPLITFNVTIRNTVGHNYVTTQIYKIKCEEYSPKK